MNIKEKIVEKLKNILQTMNVSDDISFTVEIPKDHSNGDYATNLAMQLSKYLHRNPRDIANEIIAAFKLDEIEKVELAGPGFINFFVSSASFSSLIEKVINLKDRYGSSSYGNGKKYNVEFVSANPTGDLHLGHARQAALGDSICNLLSFVGYDVTREYYINDAGVQIEKLAISILCRYKEALGMACEFPEDGYHGPDIIAFGKELADKYGNSLLNNDLSYFKKIGIEYELNKIIEDLNMFNVHFDVFTHETMLYSNGWVDNVIPALKEKGYIYEEDGAIWFKTTAFSDDKDRVLKKSDGTYTYFTPDIAYHKYKLERGFDYLVDILGADHHGYIGRMKAAIDALGYSSNQLEMIIHQMVRLIKDGEELKLSKRTGKAYTLRDLCEEIGIGCTRFQFASKSASTQMEIDIDAAIKKSNENPVYYIQYAHARCSSILAIFEKMNIKEDLSGSLLTSKCEIDLLKHINEFDKVVLDAALNKAPFKLTNYLYTLASYFHSFYNECKVIDQDNEKLTSQRVVLAKITGITIKNGLKLIGVDALDKM